MGLLLLPIKFIMFIFLLVVALFIIIWIRINRLEEKINLLSAGKPVQPEQKQKEGYIAPNLYIKTVPNVPEPAVAQEVQQPVTASPITASQDAPMQSAQPKAKTSSDGTEFAVGSKVLTGGGIIAVFLGVIFFLRYAFENNLISEPMRVLLGVAFGIILCLIGFYLKNKYFTYAVSLIGAGLGVVYLSVYSAYAFYQLISVPAAFLILFIVTIIGAALSVLFNSKPLISFSLVGAFLIPVMLPAVVSVHILLGYLLILAIGIALVARYKVWPELTVGSLVGVSLVALTWVSSPIAKMQYFETCIYLTLIFLLFIVTTVINYIQRDRNYKGIDGFLLYAVPSAYFILNVLMLEDRQDVALLMFAIGAFYAVAAVVVRVLYGHLGEVKTLSNIMILIASIGIAGATALHFEDHVNTLLWAIEAIVILFIGIMLNARANRVSAMILALLTFFRAISLDLTIPNDAVALFNTRSLVLLFTLAPFVIMWVYYKFYAHPTGAIDDQERTAGRYMGALGLFCIPLLWLSLETLLVIDQNEHLYLPLVWSIYIAFAAALSFLTKEFILRFASYILAGVTVFTILSSQWNLPADFYVPLVNIRVLSTVIFLLVLAGIVYAARQYKEQILTNEDSMITVLLATICGMLLWLISIEVLDYFNTQIRELSRNGTPFQYEVIRGLENTKRVALSAAWLLYALISLAIGIFYRLSSVRYFTIGLLAFTVAKIFLYDTANLNDAYRFVSYISLGVILLLASYAYYRFKDRILQFVHIEDRQV